MSLEYRAVQWNRQKRIYDTLLAAGVGGFLAVFIGATRALHPQITDEILLMRATASAAFVLLHVILCIGPLCRLNPQFLPLLYNRRHAGVTMALLALAHATLAVVTYHAGGNLNPLVSIFVSEKFTGALATLPFQPFGFVALLIILLMAATSHDFWLANLTAPVWKALHMLVYLAYALLIVHVTFGVLQAETHPLFAVATGLGLVTVIGLHLASALKERKLDQSVAADVRRLTSTAESHQTLLTPAATEGFVDVCAVADLPENRARIVCLSGERVAIFKYDGKISAVSNVCQHQNGPLGEGKIVDGCITCPWHGYQYLPDTGASPPPFVEKVPTFNVRVMHGRVYVHPRPNPPGARVEPALVGQAIVAADVRRLTPNAEGGVRSAESRQSLLASAAPFSK
jgi:nitrite reductase/ring-hydroxylating ferredoxin subunit/DMSO/TMAO reductase YedYZ heme-binding membrane subunit